MRSIDYRPPDGYIPYGYVQDLRPIPGYEGWFVDQLGHLRSNRARWGTGPIQHRSILLQDGRWTATIWRHVTGDKHRNGKREAHTVASLVMLAFHGPKPARHIVAYLDGDMENHCLWNLKYMKRAEARKIGAAIDIEPSPWASLRLNPKPRVPEPEVPARKPRAPKPPPMSRAEVAQAVAEWKAGRKLRRIWQDRHQDALSWKIFVAIIKHHQGD